MAEKRYQVFVSSTFEDLKNERGVVLSSLQSTKFIPMGMESFSASTEEQMKYIRKVMDDTDYCILIIKSNYGQIDGESGKSYTEMEYDYAILKGIPVLVFINSDEVLRKKSTENEENKDKLSKFINKVSAGRLFKSWINEHELAMGVVTSLFDEIKSNPRPGWIRGDAFVSMEKEYRDMKVGKIIEQFKSEMTSIRVDDLADGDDKIAIEVLIDDIFSEYLISSEEVITWNSLFLIFAEKGKRGLTKGSLERLIIEKLNWRHSEEDQILTINEESMETIITQFDVLGLIDVILGEDNVERIYLTERGKLRLKELRSVKKSHIEQEEKS